MKENFDYNCVPRDYIHCLNEQCLRSADCLRFRVGAFVDDNVQYFRIVNPVYVNKQGECGFFQPDELVRNAYGISHLYDNLSMAKYSKIKKIIHDYFGHSEYYRIYNKQVPIKPDDQSFIRELFIKEEIDSEPLFDEYLDQYDFFSTKKQFVPNR